MKLIKTEVSIYQLKYLPEVKEKACLIESYLIYNFILTQVKKSI